MTSVVSIRVTSELQRIVRQHAVNAQLVVAALISVIIEHALCGKFKFVTLPDVQPLDAKLDVRLSDDLIAKLRAECERLRVSVSVYIRRILCAYYAKRLVFTKKDGHYTLEENYDQTKSA